MKFFLFALLFTQACASTSPRFSRAEMIDQIFDEATLNSLEIRPSVSGASRPSDRFDKRMLRIGLEAENADFNALLGLLRHLKSDPEAANLAQQLEGTLLYANLAESKGSENEHALSLLVVPQIRFVTAWLDGLPIITGKYAGLSFAEREIFRRLGIDLRDGQRVDFNGDGRFESLSISRCYQRGRDHAWQLAKQCYRLNVIDRGRLVHRSNHRYQPSVDFAALGPAREKMLIVQEEGAPELKLCDWKRYLTVYRYQNSQMNEVMEKTVIGSALSSCSGRWVRKIRLEEQDSRQFLLSLSDPELEALSRMKSPLDLRSGVTDFGQSEVFEWNGSRARLESKILPTHL